jgi:uncharacterized protein YlxW (UPF0749 family)
MKKTIIALGIAAALPSLAFAEGALTKITNDGVITFSAGTAAKADDVNANFSDVVNAIIENATAISSKQTTLDQQQASIDALADDIAGLEASTPTDLTSRLTALETGFADIDGEGLAAAAISAQAAASDAQAAASTAQSSVGQAQAIADGISSDVAAINAARQDVESNKAMIDATATLVTENAASVQQTADTLSATIAGLNSRLDSTDEAVDSFDNRLANLEEPSSIVYTCFNLTGTGNRIITTASTPGGFGGIGGTPATVTQEVTHYKGLMLLLENGVANLQLDVTTTQVNIGDAEFTPPNDIDEGDTNDNVATYRGEYMLDYTFDDLTSSVLLTDNSGEFPLGEATTFYVAGDSSVLILNEIAPALPGNVQSFGTNTLNGSKSNCLATPL